MKSFAECIAAECEGARCRQPDGSPTLGPAALTRELARLAAERAGWSEIGHRTLCPECAAAAVDAEACGSDRPQPLWGEHLHADEAKRQQLFANRHPVS